MSLVDVLPTVLDALGLPPRDVDGVSLLPLVNGHTLPPRDLYAETFAPLFDFGWSSLRSVRSGPWKYIAAPGPELYNVASDAAEAENRLLRDEPRARDLAARVSKYSGPEPPAEAGPAPPIDAESRGRLGALGYVASSPAGDSGSRPDPKEPGSEAARMAQVVTGELEGAALRAALEAIVSEDPRNGQAQMRLGYALVESGDLRGGRDALPRRAGAPRCRRQTSISAWRCALRRRAGQREAARALMEARRIEPGNPVVEANLGALALDGGDMTKAVEFLGAALQIDPDLHQARFNLARALARQGRRGEALKEAETLLQRLPAAGAAARGSAAARCRAAIAGTRCARRVTGTPRTHHAARVSSPEPRTQVLESRAAALRHRRTRAASHDRCTTVARIMAAQIHVSQPSQPGRSAHSTYMTVVSPASAIPGVN